MNLFYYYLIAINLLTFIAYGYDKRQAADGGKRVPENSLHLLTLLGASPGAWAAIFFFRHKIRKFSFWSVTLGVTLAQTALAYWLIVHILKHSGE